MLVDGSPVIQWESHHAGQLMHGHIGARYVCRLVRRPDECGEDLWMLDFPVELEHVYGKFVRAYHGRQDHLIAIAEDVLNGRFEGL